MEDKEIWSGIDVSKEWFDASWVTPESRSAEFEKIPCRRFERSRRGVRRYVAWLRRQGSAGVWIVMESTAGYQQELCVWLVEELGEVTISVVNPRQALHFHKSLGLRNRSDRADARSLGLLGRERRPRVWEPLGEEYQRLRQLVRERRRLVTLRAAEKVRLQEVRQAPRVVRQGIGRHIRQLSRMIEALEEAMERTVACSERLREDVGLLMSIPRVGWLTAVTVLAELGDLRRFNRSRQLGAMSGLCPATHQSGRSRWWTAMDGNGNAHVRMVLHLAAMGAAREGADDRLARFYRHLVNERGKAPTQAMVAVARKTLIIMRAMLIEQLPYIDDYPSRGARAQAA